MVEIVTIGEPLVLFAAEDEDQSLAQATHFHKYLAGAEVNVAVGATRLGHSVDYLTAVGDGPNGEFITQALAARGIETDHIVVDPAHWTGVMFKQKTSVGDPATFYMRKDSAAANLTASQLPDLDLTATRVAHLTGIYAGVSATSRETLQALIGRLHQANVPISFDPNLRPALWPDEAGMRQTLNRLAQEATLVLPGLKEGRTLTGEETPEAIAQFYFDQSPRTKAVVIKLGSRGASFHTRVGAHGTVPGFVAERVVDTVGAGDGFALGVLTARLEGLDWAQATARGNAIGALGVQSPSDNDGYPDQAGLKQFIKTATRAVD